MAATSIKGEAAANSGVNGMFGEIPPVQISPCSNTVPLLDWQELLFLLFVLCGNTQFESSW